MFFINILFNFLHILKFFNYKIFQKCKSFCGVIVVNHSCQNLFAANQNNSFLCTCDCSVKQIPCDDDWCTRHKWNNHTIKFTALAFVNCNGIRKRDLIKVSLSIPANFAIIKPNCNFPCFWVYS